MTETARSRNGIPIRLPDERWIHLTEGHSEMAGYYSDVLETMEDPDAIYEGISGGPPGHKEDEKR